jgi:hypothetical protein
MSKFNLSKAIELPRNEFETVISSLEGDALDLFAYGDRIEQIGKLIKERFQEAAVAQADSLSMVHGNTFVVGGDKISLRRTKKWTFMDRELEHVQSKLTPLEKDVKALKLSIKAREDYLVQVGEAILDSESISISIAKK